MPRDALGNTVSGAGSAVIDAYARALREFQCYIGDPVATIDAALSQRPEFVMGHVLRAYLHLLGTEPGGLPLARAALEAAGGLPANARERAHLRTIANILCGQWHAASRVLEDLSIDHPHDALALQAGHLIDFLTGSSRMLRERIARALPAWSPDMPGYHALLGMHAFGLEETGHYARAEAAGRRAVELESRDGWAWHAVAHVMEMQARPRAGIAWLRNDTDAWAQESFFSVHNWWHLALFHLDLDNVTEVLKLFDGPIYGKRSQVLLDMIDASALLWRLHLRGIDVGARWQAVADAWEPIAAAGNYAFNDAHAMMAFVGAQRAHAANAVLEAQQRVLAYDRAGAVAGAGDNVVFTREIGAPLTHAIQAFGAARYAEVVNLLRPIRNDAQRFGGSHAQRDLIDLTLIEAALRDGQQALARALTAERSDVKPTSPSGCTLWRRAQTAVARAA